MHTQSKRGRAQDRAKVARRPGSRGPLRGGKDGREREQVRQAVKSTGNARTKVELQLAGSERKDPKKAGQQG